MSNDEKPIQEFTDSKRSTWIAIGLLSVLIGVAVWRMLTPVHTLFKYARGGIMSTPQYNILVTLPTSSSKKKCAEICVQADQAARWVEREMNIYNPNSPLSKFNAGPAGDYPVDPKLLRVLRVSREVHLASGGAFDVTARPLILLWKQSLKNIDHPAPAFLLKLFYSGYRQRPSEISVFDRVWGNVAPLGGPLARAVGVRLVPPLGEFGRAMRIIGQSQEDLFRLIDWRVHQVQTAAWQTLALPGMAERKRARAQSQWDDFVLPAEGTVVQKKRASGCVDLGGVAKGYAIDLAIESLMAQDMIGGMVDIGGDIRCFGKRPGGSVWRMAIGDPYNPMARYLQIGGEMVVIGLRNEAMCTSGDYERGRQVYGRRFSHIVNPATLDAHTKAPSVTVVAKTAVLADAWATALSVLGPAGLDKLKGTDIEALMLMGDDEESTVYYATENFEKRFLTEMKYPKGK
ncbi:MAG: FAD:protein FMN transferase [Phycisphaerales bacterium]|jgi:thiamine biosynthesis lipoprotein ApbE|nr:FAD:protein FMN transferase [Phycisphaerales bacterium]MBT7170617.1 FAD:protein FMN transferase [Phycisphaerales bacterium]